MTTQQRERVKQLYGDALELPVEQREKFVRESPAEAEVHAETLRLLRLEECAGDFLKYPVLQDRTGAGGAHVFAGGQIVAGRYRIERFLKSGGMGEVYEAFDRTLNRRIALKALRSDMASNPAAMARFRREVAVARDVTHPNVCRVFDIGEHQAGGAVTAFLTMEFLEGESLAERLHRCGPMPAQVVIPLIRQLALALETAHRANVIHRDFKPGNVMLVPGQDGEERAVVTEFGIARSTGGVPNGEQLTQTGQFLGTPGYIAPEVWRGAEPGPAADIYALGVVAREMLAGSGQEHQPTPANAGLNRVIERCTEASPAARPPTAAWVLSELDPPRGPGRRVWMWLAAAAIILACVAASYRLYSREGRSHLTNSAQHVAVLPFRAGEPELQVFADGLMEAITQRLSQYEGIHQQLVVAPATEIRRGSVSSPGDARAKFGAQFAVEGSLHAQQDRLRLVMSVVDTSTMRQIRSGIVEGSRARAISLQDEALAKLANALELRVQPGQAADLNRLSSIKPGAYDFYLQGMGYLRREDRPGDVDNAVTVFLRAIEMDGEYAAAYGGLAQAYWVKYQRSRDVALARKAEEYARQGVGKDGNSVDARIALGQVMNGTGRYQDAVSQFDAALRLDSRNTAAYQGLALTYLNLKRPQDAEATYRKAVELRPSDWTGHKQLGLFYYQQGQVRKAIEEFEQVVALTPDNAQGYVNLGSFLYLDRQLDRARKVWEDALRIDPKRHSLHSNLGTLLFKQGRYAEASARFRLAAEDAPKSHKVWGNLAAAYRWSGDQRMRDAYQQAISLALDDVKVNPKSTETFSYLARYYAVIEDRQPAAFWLEKAVAATKIDKSSCVRIAEVYENLGQRAAAIQWMRRAVESGASADEVAENPRLREVAQAAGIGAGK
ncbi:MAG: tetratricopeptide repeat protein [Bryobacteraceae bacterium]|nr:tetratricopeptide repeat protein [Bryobacteraceae bacterium]